MGKRKAALATGITKKRQAKISYLYIKPKQEVCQMDDKELMICLMKEYFELKNQIKIEKETCEYWFRECERLKNEQKQ